MAGNKRKFDWDYAAILYTGGLSPNQIGELLGVAGGNVRRSLIILGVELRGISEGKSLRSRGNRHKSGGYTRITTGLYERPMEHIQIAERALGRRLKTGEVVHHINCDGTDNRNDNLLICSRSYHTALHWRMRRHPYWKQFGNHRSAST